MLYQSDPSLPFLAPTTITSYRSLRYDGGAMGSDLAAFPLADQALLREVYAALRQTFAMLRAHEAQPEPDIVPRLVQLYDERWHALTERMQQLGATLHTTPQLRQITHDLKGGAFQALLMLLQLFKVGLADSAMLHRMFFLTRDQLKIMRNALPTLDPEATARDAQQQLHAVELLVEKWSNARHLLSAQNALVTVDARYSGAIAERCLEFSALDRVLYNLINNATTHSADAAVRLTILPLPEDQPLHLRFIVANSVTPEQRIQLEERFPTNLGELFVGGFTTSGSGLGLRICADFVCNAYGLRSVEQGLAEGHFGAALHGDQFYAWVHWPIAAD
jgi:signal transduction histidine kinase